jgi:hypothetical protein
MKKQFLVTVTYPDGDYIATNEFTDVIEEAIEYAVDNRMESLSSYLDANIMDGESGRLITTVEPVKIDQYNYSELTPIEVSHINDVELTANALMGIDNKYSVVIRKMMADYRGIGISMSHKESCVCRVNMTKTIVRLFNISRGVDVELDVETLKEVRCILARNIRLACEATEKFINKLKCSDV